MLELQKNGKTIKEYTTTYAMADDIENAIPNRTEIFYKKAKNVLNTHAFEMCIKGAKITFGDGYRLICPL